MQHIAINWKTSLAGAAMILGAVTDILHALSTGSVPSVDADITAVVGGAGLIFAKDGNVQ